MKKERNNANKIGWLKKVGRVLGVALPLTVAIASGVGVVNRANVAVKASSKVEVMHDALDESIAFHEIGDDETALEIMNEALRETYGIEVNSYTDAILTSHELIGEERGKATFAGCLVVAGGTIIPTSLYLAREKHESNKKKRKKEKEAMERAEYEYEVVNEATGSAECEYEIVID